MRRAFVAVLVVLVLAGGVFGVRSWVGTEPASDDAASAPGTVPTTASPTPSASATPSPTPTPSRTPTPSPSADEPTPTPTPTRATPAPRRTEPPRTTRSTGAVVAEVKASLDGRGQPTSVWCPPTVSAAVGTAFTCTVAYASDPAVVIADAQVRITTADGDFTWRSVSRS